MNKTVKGSLAGAAGIALLMGGFGTYALWSQDATLGSSSVTAGHLTVSTSPGSYADATPTALNTNWSGSDVMVPGDVVTYTQTFNITGTGKNLKGSITLAPLGTPTKLDGTTPTNFSTLQRSVTLSDPDDAGTNFQVVAGTGGLKYDFSSPFSSATVTAQVTYTFPAGDGTLGTTNKDAEYKTPNDTFTIAQR